jgi:hypothetical protein
VIAQTSSHAWRDPQSLVDSSEIVVYGVDRNQSRVILTFFTESIRQSGKAPHPHSHAQVVPLHVGCTHMIWVGIAAYNLHVAANFKLRYYPSRRFESLCAVGGVGRRLDPMCPLQGLIVRGPGNGGKREIAFS